MKVLITCPPMRGMIDELRYLFEEKSIEIFYPEIVQAMEEHEVLKLIADYDGWIIGDDPATRAVFEAGKKGNLKAAVKWGVGTDNVDFDAARELSIPVTNTPNMFGQEVGDIVMSYITSLARKTFLVNREVKEGNWPKPRGISLSGKTLGIVGFGDTGKAIAKRAIASEMKVRAYIRSKSDDVPVYLEEVDFLTWPEQVVECDFLVLACSLNTLNWHMINAGVLSEVKKGVRIINVARGHLIEEDALVEALRAGTVQSVALDVFETEPLPLQSKLRNYEQCIFGSHNASNTSDAVMRTSKRAIDLLFELLEVK